MRIASLGNGLLQHNTLDNKTFDAEPTKIAAVVGLGANLIALLSAILRPFVPGVSDSIASQMKLPTDILIPSTWTADTIKPGHKIGAAVRLFTLIPTTKEAEWKEQFGGEEVRKMKEEAAKKAAKKKADKDRKKAKKAAEKDGTKPGPTDEDVQEIAKKVEELRT